MMTHRVILHLDLDAFFCAVSTQQRPELEGTAFAVGGRPEERGVVASCSYPARRYGIHSAMPMAQAVRLCPNLVIVPPDFPAYRAASRAVMERLRARTPLVEQLSIDEAFLDVSALPCPGREVAAAIQTEISAEQGLSCSLGVATNKLCAKIATDVAKARARSGQMPQAIWDVPPGGEAAFLAPLPVTALWGVGPKTAERLTALGMRTIGDIAAWPEDDLIRRFGQHGRSLARHAQGIDERPIQTTRVAKSISQEETFHRDRVNRTEILHVIAQQAREVSDALQRKGLSGVTVTLKVRWSDFTTLTRQTTLPQPTDTAGQITAVASKLFDTVWEGRPVRLIGVGMSGLLAAPQQPTLWESEQVQAAAAKRQQLNGALAALRARFGGDVVQRGSELLDL
ncbi:MAG: DNA polymerase IV [Chloroflexi bacterium]|nr:MAG: DNA polymerase IV [Chloroflexota bacterium]